MIFIRSLLFKIAYYIIIAVLAISCSIFRIFGRNFALRVAHFVAKGVRWALKWIAGVEVVVEGEIPTERPVILAPKHQSSLETFLFHALIYRTAYVFKKELSYIPVMGWALSATGNIPIPRDQGVKAIGLMLKGADLVLSKEKRTLVIFPEGTRYPVGAKPVYHSGVVMFYRKFPDVPIYPVAINSGLFMGKKGFLIRPGKLVFRFLPAMPAGLSKEEFMAELERRIEAEMPEMTSDKYLK